SRKDKYFEIPLSGVGFENNWVNLQLSRGTESWGAGEGINILLNYESFPYNYFKMTSDYGRIRVAYLHGSLESRPNLSNRFFTSKGIEFSNRRSFILSLSESVIYSGKDRQIEFGYINPISQHLEVEWNDRLKVKGESSSNACWQLSFEYLKNQIRLSGNFIIDEFVLDKDIQKNKKHAIAYSLRISKAVSLKNINNSLTLYTSFLKVGTPTFRHIEGNNNFVNNEFPLGWQNGSDGFEYNVGFNYFKISKYLIQFNSKFLFIGSFSIVNSPYEPYTTESYYISDFPSGEIEKKEITTINFFRRLGSIYSFNSNVSFDTKSFNFFELNCGFEFNFSLISRRNKI
ncbi:hypothetical protein N9N24_03115, partial [Candidatus Marinimicrobia bacterium]|nr:hypothetical protein [Candidatus Neomarinimicrobiota bacterium]